MGSGSTRAPCITISSSARVDVEDSPENWQSMRDFKETLKVRFEQLDIWITAHRIEIV